MNGLSSDYLTFLSLLGYRVVFSLEFIDGQMDQKQGKKPLSGGDLSNNECDSPAKISEDKDSVDNSFYETTRTVLEQPMPTRGMANLDKVIHTKGIRLFTDIFFR